MSKAGRNRPRNAFNLRQRLRWVALALGLCSVSLVGRAAYVQIINSDFYQRQGEARYLRELPISSLKIDREFIGGIESSRDRNLVAGMIAMAHSIGKEVVAEGIETPRQLELLAEIGCDWGQGYLWSRPIPPDQALAEFG